MQIGMTKDQGLYNKPWAAVHPGALAAGTLPQYNNNNIKYPLFLSNKIETCIFSTDVQKNAQI